MQMKYREHEPIVDESCFLAQNSVIIGDVTLKKNVSIWYGTVIRGDKDHIEIDEDSNVQDNCTLHTDPDHILYIGKRVTVGHSAVIHGAYIEDECLIGMGAVILNGAHIHKHSIIGAGAVVSENTVIPENSIAVGCPAKVIKMVSDEQVQDILDNAGHYCALGQEYKHM